MFQDRGEERRRLNEVYAQKYDRELLELAADSADLTELAREVLREEMNKRRLVDPEAATRLIVPPRSDANAAGSGAAVHWEPIFHRFEPLPDQALDDLPHEYTWKVSLCECETREQAAQLGEALRRAQIDCWIETPPNASRYGSLDMSGYRVRVAADQLEQAQAIAAQPIAQDIVSEITEPSQEATEFSIPKCPRCGAEEPVLMGADQTNSWRCEECGHEWTDPGDGDSSESKNQTGSFS